jgi:hypothetical protein
VIGLYGSSRSESSRLGLHIGVPDGKRLIDGATRIVIRRTKAEQARLRDVWSFFCSVRPLHTHTHTLFCHVTTILMRSNATVK